jgi:predicted metal-dependent hydrolase
MENKSVTIEGIGEIELKKTDKVRRLSIRIVPFKGVIVSIPQRTSYAGAERFVLEKKEWIIKSLAKIRKHEALHRIIDENTAVSIRQHTLKLIFEDRNNIGVVVTTSMLYVKFPKNIDIRHKRMQDVIKEALEHTMKIEAENYLPQRLKQLATDHDFKHGKITIRNTISKWGSCAPDDSISLSIHLIRLPDELIDYVLLHELVHTVHKNHGIKFWQLLDKVAGQAKLKAKKMRKYSMGVY